MAWSAPMTFVDGTALAASQLNVYLRDNMMETEAAKATTFGGLFISNGPNEIVERVGGSDFISEAETTNSTGYVSLPTDGPKIVCNTGTRAFYFMTAQISVDVANLSANMSIEVSGQTQSPAADTGSLQIDGLTIDKPMRIGICGFYQDLVPGENTFTCRYKCLSGSNATFSDRALTVLPF